MQLLNLLPIHRHIIPQSFLSSFDSSYQCSCAVVLIWLSGRTLIDIMSKKRCEKQNQLRMLDSLCELWCIAVDVHRRERESRAFHVTCHSSTFSLRRSSGCPSASSKSPASRRENRAAICVIAMPTLLLAGIFFRARHTTLFKPSRPFDSTRLDSTRLAPHSASVRALYTNAFPGNFAAIRRLP